MKLKKAKRLLAILLVMVMVSALLPLYASAEVSVEDMRGLLMSIINGNPGHPDAPAVSRHLSIDYSPTFFEGTETARQTAMQNAVIAAVRLALEPNFHYYNLRPASTYSAFLTVTATMSIFNPSSFAVNITYPQASAPSAVAGDVQLGDFEFTASFANVNPVTAEVAKIRAALPSTGIPEGPNLPPLPQLLLDWVAGGAQDPHLVLDGTNWNNYVETALEKFINTDLFEVSVETPNDNQVFLIRVALISNPTVVFEEFNIYVAMRGAPSPDTNNILTALNAHFSGAFRLNLELRGWKNVAAFEAYAAERAVAIARTVSGAMGFVNGEAFVDIVPNTRYALNVSFRINGHTQLEPTRVIYAFPGVNDGSVVDAVNNYIRANANGGILMPDDAWSILPASVGPKADNRAQELATEIRDTWNNLFNATGMGGGAPTFMDFVVKLQHSGPAEAAVYTLEVYRYDPEGLQNVENRIAAIALRWRDHVLLDAALEAFEDPENGVNNALVRIPFADRIYRTTAEAYWRGSENAQAHLLRISSAFSAVVPTVTYRTSPTSGYFLSLRINNKDVEMGEWIRVWMSVNAPTPPANAGNPNSRLTQAVANALTDNGTNKEIVLPGLVLPTVSREQMALLATEAVRDTLKGYGEVARQISGNLANIHVRVVEVPDSEFYTMIIEERGNEFSRDTVVHEMTVVVANDAILRTALTAIVGVTRTTPIDIEFKAHLDEDQMATAATPEAQRILNTSTTTNFTGVTAEVTSVKNPNGTHARWDLTVRQGSMSLAAVDISVIQTVPPTLTLERRLDAIALSIRDVGIGIDLSYFANAGYTDTDRANEAEKVANDIMLERMKGFVGNSTNIFEGITVTVLANPASSTDYEIRVRHPLYVGTLAGRGNVRVFPNPGSVVEWAVHILQENNVTVPFDGYRSIDDVIDAARIAVRDGLDDDIWSKWFKDVNISLRHATGFGYFIKVDFEDTSSGERWVNIPIIRYTGPTQLVNAAVSAITRDDTILLDQFAATPAGKATLGTIAVNDILDEVRAVYNAVMGQGTPPTNIWFDSVAGVVDAEGNTFFLKVSGGGVTSAPIEIKVENSPLAIVIAALNAIPATVNIPFTVGTPAIIAAIEKEIEDNRFPDALGAYADDVLLSAVLSGGVYRVSVSMFGEDGELLVSRQKPIAVSMGESDHELDDFIDPNGPLNIVGDFLVGIGAGTTVTAFIGQLDTAALTAAGYTVKVFNSAGTEITGTARLATGQVVKVFNAAGVEVDEVTVVVRGDTNGSGIVDILDATRVLNHVATGNPFTLSGPFLVAANLTPGALSILDATAILNLI
jgi:hypothetical protein